MDRVITHRSVIVVYITLQILNCVTIIGALIAMIINPDSLDISLFHIFIGIITFVCFNVPTFITKKFKIYIPNFLHIIALVFIYVHFILGETYRVYDHSAWFDKALHTISGIVFVILGVSVVNLLNNDRRSYLKLTPFLVAAFAFCFAMTLAVLWEFFELGVDTFFGGNMQRWHIPDSVLADPPADIGRLGLLDTMIDLLVAFIGSFVTAVICYIFLKRNSRILNTIMFRDIKQIDKAIAHANEVHDEKYLQLLIAMRNQQDDTNRNNKVKMSKDK